MYLGIVSFIRIAVVGNSPPKRDQTYISMHICLSVLAVHHSSPTRRIICTLSVLLLVSQTSRQKDLAVLTQHTPETPYNNARPLERRSQNIACRTTERSLFRALLVLDGMMQRPSQTHPTRSCLLLRPAAFAVLPLPEPTSPQRSAKAAVVVEAAAQHVMLAPPKG